jgi:hypothetical protein
MANLSVNRYTIKMEQGQGHGLGSLWIVRVYRKSLLRNRLVSSDWFLDRVQAERFVRDAANILKGNQAADLLRHRPPGWILSRPAH